MNFIECHRCGTKNELRDDGSGEAPRVPRFCRACGGTLSAADEAPPASSSAAVEREAEIETETRAKPESEPSASLAPDVAPEVALSTEHDASVDVLTGSDVLAASELAVGVDVPVMGAVDEGRAAEHAAAARGVVAEDARAEVAATSASAEVAPGADASEAAAHVEPLAAAHVEPLAAAHAEASLIATQAAPEAGGYDVEAPTTDPVSAEPEPAGARMNASEAQVDAELDVELPPDSVAFPSAQSLVVSGDERNDEVRASARPLERPEVPPPAPVRVAAFREAAWPGSATSESAASLAPKVVLTSDAPVVANTTHSELEERAPFARMRSDKRQSAAFVAISLLSVIAAFFLGRSTRPSPEPAAQTALPTASSIPAAEAATGVTTEVPNGAPSASAPGVNSNGSEATPSAVVSEPRAAAHLGAIAPGAALSNASQGKNVFDAQAAARALSDAAARASTCRRLDEPSGRAVVTVTFNQAGHVATANVAGVKFSSVGVRNCIGTTLRNARIPAFAGAPVTVKKTLRI